MVTGREEGGGKEVPTGAGGAGMGAEVMVGEGKALGEWVTVEGTDLENKLTGQWNEFKTQDTVTL